MDIFLYLTKSEWVRNWIEGGKIPIALASAYRRSERSGIYTVDENLISDLGFKIEELQPLINIGEGGGLRGATIKNNFVNGRRLPETEDGNYYREDGLILSFSLELSKEIARKMNKVACVRILDIDGLKGCIDEQLGVKGKMAACKYTLGDNRNHFLKSEKDSWQREYRMFWPGSCARTVNLPRGYAKLVELQINLT